MAIPTPNISWLSTEGWYHYSQKFLESTYLLPFKFTLNGSKAEMHIKKNIRNGFIEREIHGAMHASRVALSTSMLDRLCQKQYPDLVQNKIQALIKFTKLNEQELFYLISYVGLGHDAARQGEGVDRWEKESATEIENFLNQRGLDPKLAKIFSTLAFLKDKPKELKRFLAEYRLSQEAVEGLEYARLLISLSDCFDIIRCVRCFDFSCIEKKLAEVFPYSQDKDAEVFFDYAKHLFHFLLKQKDLYCPNKLKGPDGKIYQVESSKEDYSVQRKVKFEHASSVLGMMVNAFNQDEYFKSLLNMQNPVTTKQFLALKTETPTVSNKDIKALRDFCAQQKNRFSDAKPLEALLSFEKKAEKIILAKLSPEEKRAKLKACAHQEFEHRDYIPRILADVLLLISSLALIGLVVGFARVANGHSFFFNADKTKREVEFNQVANGMELSL